MITRCDYFKMLFFWIFLTPIYISVFLPLISVLSVKSPAVIDCVVFINDQNFNHLKLLLYVRNYTIWKVTGHPTIGALVLLQEPVKMKRWGLRNCQIDRLPVKCKSMPSRVFDEMIGAMKTHITSNSALEEIDLRDNLFHQTDYESILQVFKSGFI